MRWPVARLRCLAILGAIVFPTSVSAQTVTVTVSGASPVVDVQNTRTQNVISRESLDAIPTAKGIQAMAALTLGASATQRGSPAGHDVGGTASNIAIAMAVHGGRATDSLLMQDGMSDDTPHTGGGASYYALNATYNVPSAQIRPELGRNLSTGTTAFAAIQIVPLYQLTEARLSQLDARFSKTVRVKGARVKGMVDIYNAFNANTVLGVNETYGSSWLTPTAVLAPRLFKIGAEVTF